MVIVLKLLSILPEKSQHHPYYINIKTFSTMYERYHAQCVLA